MEIILIIDFGGEIILDVKAEHFCRKITVKS